jgi:hypothetical protein
MNLSKQRPLIKIVGLIIVIALIWRLGVWLFAVSTINQSLIKLRADQSTIAERESAISAAASSVNTLTQDISWLGAVTYQIGGDACVLQRINDTTRILSTVPLQSVLVAALDALAGASEAGVPITALRTHIGDLSGLQSAVEQARQLQNCENPSPTFARYQEGLEGVLFVLEAVADVQAERLLTPNTRWLILLNNTDELRASGGFITALFVVDIDEDVLRWRIDNSYNVESEADVISAVFPPEPLRRYMGLPRWVLRDANWSPDYPTAARQIITFYERSHPERPVNGVVTVNMTAVEILAEYASPLQVLGQPFTPANALDQIREQWNNDAAQFNSDAPERKNFIRDYAIDLLSAINVQTGAADKARLGLAAQAMLQRRDVLLYSADETIQQVLHERGWDGALRATEGDYLMIVDTNMGYNKVSGRVSRQVNYTVTLGETPQAQLEIIHRNENTTNVPCTQYDISYGRPNTPTYADRMTGCYWNYLRFFAPRGLAMQDYDFPQLPADWFPFTQVSERPIITAYQEASFDGIGAMTIVPTNDSVTARFDYQLPASIGQDGRYTLLVQRQAGTHDTQLQIQVRLPANRQIISTLPNSIATNSQEILYNVALSGDVWIEVEYE